jgi:hypothetical protein
MRASSKEWRKERLKRATRGQDVIHHQHAGTRRNLKPTSKLSPSCPRLTSHLFGEDAAHAKKAADLVRKEHSTSGWTGNQVDLHCGGLRHGERALR